MNWIEGLFHAGLWQRLEQLWQLIVMAWTLLVDLLRLLGGG
ncbi:hypothetical protein [Paraburkholderia phosphatilytica]|nr:hypothetical protein [Paraburkholderia phosphatilytica]